MNSTEFIASESTDVAAEDKMVSVKIETDTKHNIGSIDVTMHKMQQFIIA